jgi:protein-tyrosine-phosphatase/DNA-binding transcriptional ArsR family regulator
VSLPPDLARRAARHAALGEVTRLAIVEELVASDRAPIELRELTGIDSNLLAHHLDVLEGVGLITRSRSSGDRRRRYVRLDRSALGDLMPKAERPRGAALFVCTQNSARSQLAAALWSQLAGAPAQSAGTHPAQRVHPGAMAAAKRSRLDLTNARPRSLDSVRRSPTTLVVTVCDRAHEELAPHKSWLHWSVPDPVATPTKEAFDATVEELRSRITAFVGAPA